VATALKYPPLYLSSLQGRMLSDVLRFLMSHIWNQVFLCETLAVFIGKWYKLSPGTVEFLS
jgi:hypothetical protein